MGQPSTPSRTATVTGLAAILLWSALVGLMRMTTEHFGATLGPALVYSVAAGMLWLTRRPRNLREFGLGYLLAGGGMFVLYEVCLALAIGLSANAHQAIEIGMVNYLWPTLTVVLTAATNRTRRPGLLIVPGVLLATLGVVGAVGGDSGLNPSAVARHVVSNPLPYLLALVAAVVWAAYSVLSPRLAHGHDGVTVFISGVAAVLWIVHLVSPAATNADVTAPGLAAFFGAAVVIAAGYACWNVGILRGNLTILASASYATPVLSSALSAVLLGAALSLQFWGGVVLVVAGSLIGWRATRDLG